MSEVQLLESKIDNLCDKIDALGAILKAHVEDDDKVEVRVRDLERATAVVQKATEDISTLRSELTTMKANVRWMLVLVGGGGGAIGGATSAIANKLFPPAHSAPASAHVPASAPAEIVIP